MVSAMPEEALDRVIAQIPVGGLGEPDEVARVVEFLADPESGYITGEITDQRRAVHVRLTTAPR